MYYISLVILKELIGNRERIEIGQKNVFVLLDQLKFAEFKMTRKANC